jgi:hypothetical protein
VSEHTNHAAPHMFENVLSRMSVRPIHTRPSGSIWASIADIASYLQFHLDPIADRGGPRLSADAATQLTAPQMYVRRSDFSEIGDVHYGLGFEVAHYRGERLIVHGGAWSGYTCDLRMLPDRGFGVAVLTNGHWHSGCPVISHPILDRLLGLDPQPWFDRLSGPAAALRAQRRKEIAVRGPPSEWVRAQAATLRTTPANMSIQPMASCESPPTTLRCAGRDSALTCRSRIDTTICLSSVQTGASGSRTRPCNSTLTGRGHRKPRPAAGTCSRADRLPSHARAYNAEREFLESLVGLYRRCGVSFRIALDEAGRLIMTRGNGPRERLRPHHGGTFTLPDDNYFRLEFRRDSSGTVDAMLFHEATGIYLVEGELAPDQDVYPSRLPA